MEDLEVLKPSELNSRGKAASQEALDPMAVCQGMMEEMKAGGKPMAMFREMAENMKGKCC